jgi:hypothetical protein
MIKLSILKTANQADLIQVQNRIVCDVSEFQSRIEDVEVKSWTGSTNEEYFCICFVKGILTITIEERECHVGRKQINYGVSEDLKTLLVNAQKNNGNAQQVAVEYVSSGYIQDVKNISFKDVVKVLKWKKPRQVPVKTGYIFHRN